MSRQVTGDKCGMVRMAFPESVSHVCMCPCAAGTQSVPVAWCGESCGETRLGMRSLESGVIAEGTDSISAATCCWHQREGLLFCPRFRHSYITGRDREITD